MTIAAKNIIYTEIRYLNILLSNKQHITQTKNRIKILKVVKY